MEHGQAEPDYGPRVPPQEPQGYARGSKVPLVIIGEAPGENEVRELRPFVGKSGELLERLLRDSGIRREDCYITNVVKYRPPKNEFKFFRKKENRSLLESSLDEVAQEVRQLDPNVVICLGNEAVAAALGDRRISARRGFVEWSNKFSCKVVATYHPAAVLRGINLYPVSLFDIRKAVREMGRKELLRETKRSVGFVKTWPEWISLLTRLRACGRVSFDIENVAEGIDSISFGFKDGDVYVGMAIPIMTDKGSYWSELEEREIWQGVQEILTAPHIGKVAQNAFYDMWHLRNDFGIEVAPVVHDTMIAASMINPEFDKDLWMLASMYTDVGFWEDSGSGLNEERWWYNAQDSCVTYEIAEKQGREIDEYGIRGFFHRVPMSVLPCMVRASIKGVRFDIEGRDKQLKQASGQRSEKIKELARIAGNDFNYASPAQLIEYFTGKGIKPVIDRKTKRPTFDADALKELGLKYPDLRELGLIKEIRDLDGVIKVIGTKLGKDGRIRCSYNVAGTETGRFSSSSAPDRTGTNLQNITKDLRKLFLPDPGCVIVKADLKQAENMMVAYMAEDPLMIDAFETGKDIHKLVAGMIFKKEEISKDERQLGKKGGHAANYMMRPKRLKEIAFEECGLVLKLTDAKGIMEAYFKAFPMIKTWHRKIIAELGKSRTLTNPFGRTRTFLGHWGDDLFREAVAFLPQGTIADWVSQCIVAMDPILDVRMQVHDEVVFNVMEGDVDRSCRLIKETMERPFKINGRNVVIPVEIAYGPNWGECVEWKIA